VNAGPESPATPLVLVVVGTDHHPFGRLVTWMDRWARDHPDARCFVQHGTASAPRVCEGTDFLAHPELRSLMAEARAVVSHGGPGTIMEMRASGHLPVVVPRDPDLGEHVDAHQQRFARVVAGRGLVRLVETESDLGQALDEALSNGRAARDAAASSTGSSTGSAAGSGTGASTGSAAAAQAFGALVEAQVRDGAGHRGLLRLRRHR